MKRKRWSQVDCDLLLAMKAEGRPTFRIAQHFGVTEHAVNMKALKLREAKLHPKNRSRIGPRRRRPNVHRNNPGNATASAGPKKRTRS